MKAIGLFLVLGAGAAASPAAGALEKRQSRNGKGATGGGAAKTAGGAGGAGGAGAPSGISGIIAGLGSYSNAGYGKVPDPQGAAPRRSEMKSPIDMPGVKRIKIRTGPYKVPNMGHKSPTTGHAGMLEAYIDRDVPKPCSNCNILRQFGGLEYPNGTNANIDSGQWLHHMVHFNAGPRRWDPLGYSNRMCLPFLSAGYTPKTAERYFVTGNERMVFNYYQPESSIKSAYHLDEADKFVYLLELMNMNMKDEVVYITMTYDVLPGALPAGWQETKTIYLDAASCGTSEIMPPQQTGKFQVSSKPWRPNFEGPITYAGGHLHDGGTNIDIKVSGANMLCSQEAIYSEKPEFVYRGMAMGKDKTAKDHISSMKGCSPGEMKVKQLKKDQSWTITGHYDYNKREGNLEGGKQSEIMAIAIVLAAVPQGESIPWAKLDKC